MSVGTGAWVPIACERCRRTGVEVHVDGRIDSPELGRWLCEPCLPAPAPYKRQEPPVDDRLSSLISCTGRDAGRVQEGDAQAVQEGVPRAEDDGPSRTREGDERPRMRELLALHAAGRIEAAPVQLGPMPETASDRHRAIADDLRLRLGLMRADGDVRPVPYAYSEAVNAGHVKTNARAGEALRWLMANGVIAGAGALKPIPGKAHGTRLYRPPGEVPW